MYVNVKETNTTIPELAGYTKTITLQTITIKPTCHQLEGVVLRTPSHFSLFFSHLFFSLHYKIELALFPPYKLTVYYSYWMAFSHLMVAN